MSSQPQHMVWWALCIVTTLDLGFVDLDKCDADFDMCIVESILASHKYFCPQAIPGDPEFNQVEKDKEVENSSQQAKTESTVKHKGHNIFFGGIFLQTCMQANNNVCNG